MRIEALMANYSPDSLRSASGDSRSIRSRTAPEQSSSKKADSVNISDAARKKLERVQQRIAQGFYNSESVAEDITDKLSGVLNDIT